MEDSRLKEEKNKGIIITLYTQKKQKSIQRMMGTPKLICRVSPGQIRDNMSIEINDGHGL